MGHFNHDLQKSTHLWSNLRLLIRVTRVGCWVGEWKHPETHWKIFKASCTISAQLFQRTNHHGIEEGVHNTCQDNERPEEKDDARR